VSAATARMANTASGSTEPTESQSSSDLSFTDSPVLR
jgi:hypothetical protein